MLLDVQLTLVSSDFVARFDMELRQGAQLDEGSKGPQGHWARLIEHGV